MKVVFAGTPDFAAAHLHALVNSHHEISAVICQPDRPGKRGNKPIFGPVKRYADKAGLSILQPEKLTANNLIDVDFGLLVVVAYGQILRADVLKYPSYGCINVHTSLLPKWRGAAPVQRSILAGDETTGITIIKIDEGLDTGDVLATEEFPIEPEDTCGIILEKMLQRCPRMLIETIDDIESGQAVMKPQNHSKASYAKKIKGDEAKINWETSAKNIDLQVRAFHPSPIAYTYLGETRIKIHRGHPVNGSGVPGTIIGIGKSGMDVACGEGFYRIEKIQLSIGTGKIMEPIDIINGRPDFLRINSIFTPIPTND